MTNAKTKSASTKSTAISDAKMAAVLENSNWANMERDATNRAATTIEKSAEKRNDAKSFRRPFDEQMAPAHDVGPEVVSGF